jgi:hypothetical protein
MKPTPTCLSTTLTAQERGFGLGTSGAMTPPMRTLYTVVLACFLLVTHTRTTLADDTIKHPGDHPHYAVELEPHLLFGWNHVYAGDGFGLGGRVSIPVTHTGFVPTINNSVAISFGLDWLRYSDCYYYFRGYAYGCGADYFEFPVALQWNFYVAHHWSVFGEPGIYIYHGSFDTGYCNAPGFPPCGYANQTGVDAAFWIGARYHFSEAVALTMRLGYPTLSIGVSFMP